MEIKSETKEIKLTKNIIDLKLNDDEKTVLNKAQEVLDSILSQVDADSVIRIEGYDICNTHDILESKFLLEGLTDWELLRKLQIIF